MILHAYLRKIQGLIKIQIKYYFESYHHNNISENVAVLIYESTDTSSSNCNLFTKPSATLLVLITFFFCNNRISF